MFIDSRSMLTREPLCAKVCVIGAGIAGITIGLELERRGIDVIVLESGGFTPDKDTTDLTRGESTGLPYEFGDGFRSRFMGGGSNCWGGWCRPLEPFDFEVREWVPNSGWPLKRDNLKPYYARAHKILDLGPPNFDLTYWVDAIDRADVRPMHLPTGRVGDGISQFSRPTRFGKQFRGELKRARHVRLLLYANVVDIETDSTGQTVQRVHVKTLSGRSFTVEASQFVLATGGIENARLLLACNKQHGNGLGNANDLVGRYFMDHPRLLLHNVRFHREWLRNKLYDAKFHYLNRSVSAFGTCIAAQMAISPDVQKRERLLNGRVWFSSIFPGEGTEAAEAIVRMKFRLHGKIDARYGFWRDLASIARRSGDSIRFIAARQLPQWLARELHFHLATEAKLQMICEPPPNPASRVTLSETRDSLGMPRARVNWQVDDQVKRTFDKTLEIVPAELQLAGVADVTLDPPLQGREWPPFLEGTWHHMGTTRMSDSPRQGVVDSHCRIHGMSNLYIAGSSVFPTAGANFPTFTIVALSLRLADHISAQMGAPVVTESSGTAITAVHDEPVAPSLTRAVMNAAFG